MWNYPEIDPVALAIGPLQIHWYGLTYVAGLAVAWWLMRKRVRADTEWTEREIDDLIFYCALGIIAGGRLGYMIFYGFADLLADPLSLLKVWRGGMSFHGGMLGVVVAMYLFAHWRNRSFFAVTDFIAPYAPFGLGFGRIGNFINGELPGRVTEVPWAVIYPGETVGRHASSLYQACLEGPVLLLILWVFTSRKPPWMAVSGMFLLAYGSLRLVSEMYRQPDAQIGFVAFNWLTMGQLLSLPMVLLGMAFLAFAYLGKGQMRPPSVRPKAK